MSLVFAFRLSMYVTLGLACACLGYAELAFLPEITVIAGLVGVLLVCAFVMEDRWSLSIPAANTLGGCLAALLSVWVAYQFVRPSGSLLDHLPWPASLLPYLGPVLMVLIPAKLFRPKHVGDYWAMQGLGLIAVALGCAMAADGVFGLLLLAYLLGFGWSLALFYLYREAARARDAGPFAGPPPDAGRGIAGRLPLFRPARRWVLAAVGLGLALFLLTPRPSGSRWELTLAGRGRMETGFSGDNQIDLTRTGTLGVNRELAFEVDAEDAAGPKTDLNPEQRWRGVSLPRYQNGRWRADRLRGSGLQLLELAAQAPVPLPDPGARRPTLRAGRLPDFGPKQYFLTFRLSSRIGSNEFLADPVVWKPHQPPPVVSLVRGREVQWVQMRDGSFATLEASVEGRTHYKQVTVPTAEPDLGPALRVDPRSLEFLRGGASAELRRWTSELLDRLAAQGKLPAEARSQADPFTRMPPPRFHEAIARALERHLSASGEYVYTLRLERQDTAMDPVEDFLFHTRAGHCERFASALALMLRSQGIPAQVVLGFKGYDSAGEGHYEVRQNHAHAWVEVLVRRPAKPEGQDAAAAAFHWLTLDPTPSVSAGDGGEGSLAEWLESAQVRGETMFKDFIIGYNADQRHRAALVLWGELTEEWSSLSDSFEEGRVGKPLAIACLVALGVAGGFAVRRLRRRRVLQEAAAGGPAAPFHARLLAILARIGHRVRAGQTPREFAETAAADLGARPALAAVAGVPLEVVSLYYRIRFGGEPLRDDDRQALDARLDALETAVAEGPGRQGDKETERQGDGAMGE